MSVAAIIVSPVSCLKDHCTVLGVESETMHCFKFWAKPDFDLLNLNLWLVVYNLCPVVFRSFSATTITIAQSELELNFFVVG